jgi:hypothetical protein
VRILEIRTSYVDSSKAGKQEREKKREKKEKENKNPR